MGILIGAQAISKEWPGARVLDNVTCSVFEGDRIGVVGANGGGKSTLLELLAQREEPDDGAITWRNGISVGILGQTDELLDDDTVGHAIVGDMPTFEWAASARIRSILDALVGDLDWDALVGTLSGGERRRCDLARLLIGTWDVLLLDEPTNHLDMPAITWLANHLKGIWRANEGALVVVTHDRWFLDEVAELMWEVHDGRVEPFEGGFSAYIQQRVERERVQQVTEERRQNFLRKELNWLAHGAKARTSKPRFRVEAALALVDQDPPLRNALELKRLAVARLGKQVIECKDVGIAFGENVLVDGLDWLIGPGERIGILGSNGAGKSTLLRVLTGRQEPTKGSVRVGASVRVGWLSQHMDLLSGHEDWTVLEHLGTYKREVRVDGKATSTTKLLERLGFDQRQLTTRIGELSGGQRRRLSLLCVIVEEPNLLVLDEPGNDLDTDMLSVLEDLLDTWPGTLLLVTHDRYLMERVTDDQYALVGGRLRHVPRGVDEFLELAAKEADTASQKPVTTPQETTETPQEPRGLTNQERREAKRRFEAISRRIEKAQDKLAQLIEAEKLVDPTNFEGLLEGQRQVAAAQAELEALEDEWLELSELLEP